VFLFRVQTSVFVFAFVVPAVQAVPASCRTGPIHEPGGKSRPDMLARLRKGQIGAIVRPVEEPLAQKRVEHELARGRINLPQTASLREGQSQAWHFAEFSPDAVEQRGLGHRDLEASDA
jgi:hypothetical protein